MLAIDGPKWWEQPSVSQTFASSFKAAAEVGNQILRVEQAKNDIKLQGLQMADSMLQQQERSQRMRQAEQEFPLRLGALRLQQAQAERENANLLHDQGELERHYYEPEYEPNFFDPKNKIAWWGKQIQEKGAEARILGMQRQLEVSEAAQRAREEKAKLDADRLQFQVDKSRDELNALKEWREGVLKERRSNRESREGIASARMDEEHRKILLGHYEKQLKPLRESLDIDPKEKRDAIAAQIKDIEFKIGSLTARKQGVTADAPTDTTASPTPQPATKPTLEWVYGKDGKLTPKKREKDDKEDSGEE